MPLHAEMTRCGNFSFEPPFPLRGPTYINKLPSNRGDNPQQRIGGMDGGVGHLIQKPRFGD
jgi:hypothetical protein